MADFPKVSAHASAPPTTRENTALEQFYQASNNSEPEQEVKEEGKFGDARGNFRQNRKIFLRLGLQRHCRSLSNVFQVFIILNIL